jgi:uncharacterized protein YbjT (DUF2867 family)
MPSLQSALLAGGTGLIGRELAAQWPGPGPLHLLVRRALQSTAPSHRVHVVDFAALPPLPAADAAFCCLGTTIQVAGSQEAFRAVDFDAVLAFARAAQGAGVTRFGVVSALGANAKSSVFYNRVKGEMEAELQRMGFARLVIARPSLLAGNRAATGQPTRLGERLTLAVTAPFTALIPKAWRPIQAATVARALLLALAQDGPAVQVLESAQLQEQGRDLSA